MQDEINRWEKQWFPNPGNNTINIKSDKSISGIEIFNNQGQLIKTVNTLNKELNISVHELPSGLYFIKTDLTNGDTCTKKLIKE